MNKTDIILQQIEEDLKQAISNVIQTKQSEIVLVPLEPMERIIIRITLE